MHLTAQLASQMRYTHVHNDDLLQSKFPVDQSKFQLTGHLTIALQLAFKPTEYTTTASSGGHQLPQTTTAVERTAGNF